MCFFSLPRSKHTVLVYKKKRQDKTVTFVAVVEHTSLLRQKGCFLFNSLGILFSLILNKKWELFDRKLF